jgi:UDP-N-acetylmuramate--alanine ligase
MSLKNLININNFKKSIGLIPLNKNVFHIIGIGGIGMSAIASILKKHGLEVQGSDMNYSQNIKRLESEGIRCFIGEHKKENIENADIIIYSTAVKNENVELSEGRKNKKIILNRAEILNYIIYSSYNILISGMHGKTTTSSMMALIFEYAKIAHLSMIGGIMEFNNLNYIVHKDFEWSIIEADESDDTFIKIPSTIPLITNISPEHLDYHLTFDNIKRKFKEFIERAPFFGFSVICTEKQEMLDFSDELKLKLKNHNIITYALEDFLDNKSDNINKINYIAKNIIFHDLNKMTFDVYCNNEFLENFELNIFGKFNISNALGCIAVSNEIGIDASIIKNALKNFKTTKRRFDIIGIIKDNVLLVDDYAHHPNEINANIETAKILAEKRGGKLICVLQPHRYSRVQKLFDIYINSKILDSDIACIMPIYAASESKIHGISSEVLSEKIDENRALMNSNLKKIEYIESFEKMNDFILFYASKNDIVLFMGAGDISKMAYDFFEKNKTSNQ